MKIVILLRYPKLQRAEWKKRLIDGLINEGYEIAVVFGESSYWRHLKAGLKEFGLDIFKKRKTAGTQKGTKLYPYFNKKIDTFMVNDFNNSKTEKLLSWLKPDVLILLGTGIIRKNILAIPNIGAVHCHEGYLPKFRGVNTIEWSIFLGQDVYISTHFVNPGIDTGDILLRKKIDLEGLHTIADVRERCKEEAADLLLRTVSGIRDNQIKRITQGKKEGKQYFAMHPLFLDIVERKLQENS